VGRSSVVVGGGSREEKEEKEEAWRGTSLSHTKRRSSSHKQTSKIRLVDHCGPSARHRHSHVPQAPSSRPSFGFFPSFSRPVEDQGTRGEARDASLERTPVPFPPSFFAFPSCGRPLSSSFSRSPSRSSLVCRGELSSAASLWMEQSQGSSRPLCGEKEATKATAGEGRGKRRGWTWRVQIDATVPVTVTHTLSLAHTTEATGPRASNGKNGPDTAALVAFPPAVMLSSSSSSASFSLVSSVTEVAASTTVVVEQRRRGEGRVAGGEEEKDVVWQGKASFTGST